MAKTHGTKRDGAPITEAMVEAMADEAEAGYDVAELRPSHGGRPAKGAESVGVGSADLDPELRRELLLRAANEGTSVSDAIPRA